jgi:hypothetical protein
MSNSFSVLYETAIFFINLLVVLYQPAMAVFDTQWHYLRGIMEDTHKKRVFLVVGPLRVWGEKKKNISP